MKIILSLILIFFLTGCISPGDEDSSFKSDYSFENQNPDYLNPEKPVDVRVNDLIKHLTLSEKISQMGNKAPSIPRLKIPAYDYWSEALHGVARQGLATVFPQAIALGSTWDTGLMEQISTVISTEARAKANSGRKKSLTFWSPTINLLRDPRWGREEEGYSEDPYLTGQMGIAFIKGMQGNDPKYLKTVSTIKHFVANNSEFNRHSGSSLVDERDLYEYYLSPFKACVMEGKVRSLMGAYNSLNNIPCCANQILLTDILRTDWGFNGFVVSDCGAINDIWRNHKYVSSPAKASAISVKAGTDINCGRTFQKSLLTAIQEGLIRESDIDLALGRVFSARFLLGEFDPPEIVPYRSIPGSKIDAPEHRELALLAAKKSIVLLKNKNNILPIDIKAIKSIAVIGPNANKCIFGGYSGSSSFTVSPLDGIREKVQSPKDAYMVIEAESYSDQSGIQTEDCKEGGRNIGYINNGDWILFRNLDFSTGCQSFIARTASLSTGGTIEIYIDSINGAQHSLSSSYSSKRGDKKIGECRTVVTKDWQVWKTVSANINTVTGIHDVYLKFSGPGTGYLFNINWIQFTPLHSSYTPTKTPGINVKYSRGCTIKGNDTSGFNEAIRIARESDIAIVVVGTDLDVANEGKDRKKICLSGVQEELVKEIHKVNPGTIVVLVTGSRLGIEWIQNNIPGIICLWYGGQSQGTALAEVLFGDYNPGAKVTATWYASEKDLPPFTDYAIRSKNRTYWYNMDKVIYPFGYGLSYTSFTYKNLNIHPDIIKIDDSPLTNNNWTSTNVDETVTISLEVMNSGLYAGDEIVQLYIHNNDTSAKLPIKKLAGFKRLSLQPGETKEITFSLPANGETMGYWDTAAHSFILHKTKIDVMAGSSSQDIRQKGAFYVIPKEK